MIKLLFAAILLIFGALMMLGSLAEGTLNFFGIGFSAVILFAGWKLYQAGRQKMFLSSASYKMAREMYDTDKRVNLDQIESNTKSKIGIIKKVKRITGFATDADTIEKTLNALQKKGLFPVDADLYSGWTTLEDPSKKKWKWGGIALAILGTLDLFEIFSLLPADWWVFETFFAFAAGCFLAARQVRVRDGEDLLKLSCGRNVEFNCNTEGDNETMYKLWLTSEFINIYANDSTVEKPYSSVQSVSLVQSKGRLAKTLQKNKKNWVSIAFDDGQEFILGFGGFGRKGAARKAEVVELIKSKAAEIKNIETPEDRSSKLSSDRRPVGLDKTVIGDEKSEVVVRETGKKRLALGVGMSLLVALGVIIYVTNDSGKTTDELEERRLVEERNPAGLKAEREVAIEEALKVLGPGKTPDPSDLQKVDQENLLLAGESGDPRAQYLLGQMYRNGYGVVKDEAEAVSWYRKSADQGNASAQYNLGVRDDEGQGGQQVDYSKVELALFHTVSRVAKIVRHESETGDVISEVIIREHDLDQWSWFGDGVGERFSEMGFDSILGGDFFEVQEVLSEEVASKGRASIKTQKKMFQEVKEVLGEGGLFVVVNLDLQMPVKDSVSGLWSVEATKKGMIYKIGKGAIPRIVAALEVIKKKSLGETQESARTSVLSAMAPLAADEIISKLKNKGELSNKQTKAVIEEPEKRGREEQKKTTSTFKQWLTLFESASNEQDDRIRAEAFQGLVSFLKDHPELDKDDKAIYWKDVASIATGETEQRMVVDAMSSQTGSWADDILDYFSRKDKKALADRLTNKEELEARIKSMKREIRVFNEIMKEQESRMFEEKMLEQGAYFAEFDSIDKDSLKDTIYKGNKATEFDVLIKWDAQFTSPAVHVQRQSWVVRHDADGTGWFGGSFLATLQIQEGANNDKEMKKLEDYFKKYRPILESKSR